MITVIITKKHMQYPGYDTYTAYEFLQLNAERLRNVEMVLIAERMNTKKLRKIRNRMNAFNIVEIDMLPDDVIDVAEDRTVHLPHSGIYIDIKDNASPEEMRKTILGHLREMTDKMLRDTGYDPSKLNIGKNYIIQIPESDLKVDIRLLSVEQLTRLGFKDADDLLAELQRPHPYRERLLNALKRDREFKRMDEDMMRFLNMANIPESSIKELLKFTYKLSDMELKNRQYVNDTPASFIIKLPDSGKVVDLRALSMGELQELVERYVKNHNASGMNLRDSAEELKRTVLEMKPGMQRRNIQEIGRTVHKRGFTAGKEHRVNVKPWLENPQVVQLFKSRQELADYLVAKLPEGTELRKRNALKFKICVELSEDKVLTLAADRDAQVALVNKYC